MTSKEVFIYIKGHFYPGNFDTTIDLLFRKCEVTPENEAKEQYLRRIVKDFGFKVINKCKFCKEVCDNPFWLYPAMTPFSNIIYTPCSKYVHTPAGTELNRKLRRQAAFFQKFTKQ